MTHKALAEITSSMQIYSDAYAAVGENARNRSSKITNKFYSRTGRAMSVQETSTGGAMYEASTTPRARDYYTGDREGNVLPRVRDGAGPTNNGE